MMINYDYVSKDNIKKHNQNWLQVPDYPYRKLTGRSESRKRNALLNLVKLKDDDNYDVIYIIYLYVIDPNKAKYQYLI